MSEYAVEVENLVKTYDHGLVRPLNGLSLKVRKGEWVAISGPSGCGKSTLLHLIAALDKPDAGRIIVDDVDLARRKDVDAYRRNEVGLIFQLHNLLPALTAMENVEVAMFGSKMSHKEQRESAAELLTAVGLGTKKKVKPPALSGGERQRIAIARALANRPLILLADEPTGSLDSEATKVVLDLFRQVHEEFHVTLLLVTHDPEVATFADRIVHMMDGRVVSESDARAERR